MPDTPSVELRNRLGEESSPYLLQHAENPVHWFAWGPEAFAAAQALNRPIFLSIGYSTCYWCHVMERESFENDAVAALLNEHFICIKVDREERPDVDDAYMAALQLLQGSGGWPLNVFLEPDAGKPFFGGTYFPPETQGQRIGFPTLIERISEVWQTNAEGIRADADRLAQAIEQQMAAPKVLHAHVLAPNAVRLGVMQLMQAYDREHGGFGGGPTKFPTPVNLDLLIEAGWNREDVRNAVTYTLDRMASGGLYDQVGGGFHRYSVDREWLVPHFEKMLYDNAQLVSTYAAVHARQPDPAYAQVIRETLAYVAREMTGADGLFHSAQDAEVNHREGDNYLWTVATMTDALTSAGLADDVDFALELYGLSEGTNFQDPHHPEDPPRNVLRLSGTLSALAAKAGATYDDFAGRVDRIDAALLAVRDTRDQPLTDDKRITSWNAMMINAYADAARVLDDRAYRDIAERAMEALLDRLVLADGSLARTRRGETAPEIPGFLEDYATTISALLALDDLDEDGPWLGHAERLAEEARVAFGDRSNGAFFDAREGQGDLFVRVRSTYDGATPSGTGVMLCNLVALAQRTGESRYMTEAGRAMRAEIETISHRPTACVTTMLALHRSGIGAEGGAPVAHDDGPIAFRVEPAELEIADGASVTFNVVLSTTGSFHVNSHEPGVEGLIGTMFALDDGAGLELSVEWPEAEFMRGAEGETIRIYQGVITVPITITRRGDVSGSPTLLVTYQPCDHHRCLEPETLPLDLTITVTP